MCFSTLQVKSGVTNKTSFEKKIDRKSFMESPGKYNQLKAMLAISRASFRSITRSPSAIVFTLAFPLIFILVFGFIRGGNVKLDVALDMSGPVMNNELTQDIISNPAFTIQPLIPGEEQIQKLRKGQLAAIIRVKELSNAPQHYTLEVETSPAAGEKGIITLSLLEHILDRYNLKAAGITQPKAILQKKEITGKAYKSIDFVLPGQLGFSLLSTGVFGTAFVFFNLRQTLVIKRFFATPIKRTYIVLGEALSRLVFALLGAMFLITLGYFAFGFTLVHGFLTLLTMLGLSALGLIVFMGFGFVVSGLAKNESLIPPLANVITLPQFLLSGTFFSIENFPSWLQPICKVLPLTHLNEALRKVAFEGAGPEAILIPVGALLIWGIIIYSAAVRVFRWE
jgi:ABC-2 type transport system permease protein